MTRTPRQKQGESLVPVIAHIPADLKYVLASYADEQGTTLSKLIRRVLEVYHHAREPARDTSAS